MSIIRLEKLLKSGPDEGLEKLVQRAQNMGELAHILRAALGNDLAEHLSAANIRDDGELVIVCSSSAWAARMRYESDTLLHAARQAGQQALRCKVTVARADQG